MTRPADIEELRELARAALRSGRLPNQMPVRTWGGPGRGAACTVCNAPVERHEVEIRLEFGGSERHHLHVRCFSCWEAERLLSAGLPDSP